MTSPLLSGAVRARALAAEMQKRQEAMDAARPSAVAQQYAPQQPYGVDTGWMQPPQQPPQSMGQQPNEPRMWPSQGVESEPTTTNEDEAVAPDSEMWSSTGKTDSFGSWFNKRSSSDALTAFGAAMLKAPTFLEGLGDGALAVNQVDRESRMPTPEEIARANMKSRIASGKGAYSPKVIQTGYDNNGNPITQMTSSNGGPPVWYDGQNNEMPNGPTNGFVRSQDSGYNQRGKDNEKFLTVARDKANQAIDNLATYDEILATAPSSNVGSGMLETMVRGMSSIAGIDLGDVNLQDKQVLTKNVSNLELQKAQTQKGLGQFTEMEREIVRKSLPAIDTELGTVLRVTVQMKLRDQLDIELYQEYMDMPDSERPRNFEDYAYKKRREQRSEYKERYQQMLESEIAQHPEYEKYSTKKKESSTSSIIDEADAIVNGN